MQRIASGVDDIAWGVEIRFADLEVNDVAAFRFQGLRPDQNFKCRLRPEPRHAFGQPQLFFAVFFLLRFPYSPPTQFSTSYFVILPCSRNCGNSFGCRIPARISKLSRPQSLLLLTAKEQCVTLSKLLTRHTSLVTYIQ